MKPQRHVVDCAIMFGLIGPAVLWFGLFSFLVLGVPSSGNSSIADWLSSYAVMVALLTLVAAYVAAIGPALAVGAAFGWVYGRYSLSYFSASAFGFSMGFIAAFAAAHTLSGVDDTLSSPPVGVGVIGGLSALVCALVATRRMGANSSFKPKPLRGSA